MLDLHHLILLICDILLLTFFYVSVPCASFSVSDPSLLRTTEVDSSPLFSWTGSYNVYIWAKHWFMATGRRPSYMQPHIGEKMSSFLRGVSSSVGLGEVL